MASDEPADSLAGLGEFAVIDRLIAAGTSPRSVVVGPGDDAAVVVAGGRRTVVSTDMLVEGRHFRLDWSSPHDVGRKAIAQNAADIEAMGPRQPRSSSRSAHRGTPRPRRRSNSPTVCGRRPRRLRRRDRRRRSGQRPAVGDLGDRARRPGRTRTGAALPGRGSGDTLAVAGEPRVGRLPDITCGTTTSAASPPCAAGIWCPEPPYGQGRVAADGGATAMTDVSDGLLADLGHIADASGVGINVSTAALTADRDALAAAAAAAGCRRVGVGARRRGRPRAGRDVSRHAAARAGGSIGTVIDGPPRVLVDGDEWHGSRGLAVV